MAFAFRPGEKPVAALTRIINEHALSTAALLRNHSLTIEERVHESRKRFKEIRALLRLLRRPLGKDLFDIENHWYRDLGRELADYRDADVIVAALKDLPPRVSDQLGPVTMREMRRLTRQEHRAVYQDAETARERLESIAALLTAAAGRLNRVPSNRFDDFTSIARGLRRTLRAGRRAMRRAYATGDSLDFHEWRKRVKDHWYHVQLLHRVAPDKLARRERLLDELSHILGDHHDIQFIRSLVASAEDTFTPEQSGQIEEALTTRQRKLERKARVVARQIASKATKSFIASIAKQWKKWAVAPRPGLRLVAGP